MGIHGTEKNTVPTSSPVVSLLNSQGKSAVLIVCEHASNFVPEKYKDLGLSKELLQSHIAWDPGANKVAMHLSKLLDAPYVKGEVSRLVYDCNRPINAASAIPEKSEIYEVPGNMNLSQVAKKQRVEEIYQPFEDCLTHALSAFSSPPAIITIHSFTAVYANNPRTVELGILHDKDTRLADAMLNVADKHTSLVTLRNEPYGPTNRGVTHTITTHASPINAPCVMIEIRNDLITNEIECKNIAVMLHSLITEALSKM
ncbi:MAG: N-formylglutamate amidohydrolase [Hyphomicrobiales bacterium]|nr:N-formylglutamate amidohydrolase [Hyphomicrobiales bacterium]PCH49947.1 MAG: N-formylglutamate amidohydrolase [Hyphomicrobiales bacterium]